MKIIKTGQPARDAIKKGIDTVADCVKVTLGPNGKNAILGRRDISPIITNDGVSIARNIVLEDEIEELGAMVVKEASTLADNQAGDGTTTTTVILQSLIGELFERMKDDGSIVAKKVDTIKLKKDVDTACEVVVSELRKRAKSINKKDIYDVAIISAEYDWLAKIITEVFEEVGKDGHVSVEEGVSNSFEISKGIEIPSGYHSEYYINSEDRLCVIEDAPVLVTNQPLEIGAVIPVIEALIAQKKNSILLIAPDFSQDMLNRLTTTKVNSDFVAVALKLPTFDKTDLLMDIATLTEAKFLDKNVFTKYDELVKSITLDNLGFIKKAVVGDSKTMLLGGKGDTKKRVAELKKYRDTLSSVFDKDNIDKRIAYLSGGIATIKIHAKSDFEKSYFKLKAEDAVNAVQNALNEGVVKGGGLALKEIAEQLEQNMLTKAIQSPYNQIQTNTGGIEIGEKVIDPVAVTISAVQNACSLAGMVLTTEVAIAYKNEPENKDED
jgi:chaperonin GroEL